MRARKSSPKSIRFNITDFNIGMEKGQFESAQELVDVLLKNYIQSKEGLQMVSTPKKQSTPMAKLEKELSKGELLKLMRQENL
jgi:hypothetical protein